MTLRRAALLAAVSLPGGAEACTVCFGGASSDMVRGFYWGVVLLLALPFLLMGTLVALVYFHSRKHRAAQAGAPALPH